ncbi:hypothetical protein GO003_006330 [Methylicorpusculum oleiharenae]|uniref:hypothetical protein n=1 Tax=Methylicorpusculum oleiharenae TaxID=1338687 RepID=UPI001356CC2E|nr:hypothetical protein [Methylicorpusculum oleiharenae]MCD2450001.1 hypothetical protein [Methylicorpusculum oleiharenae]
MIQKSEGHNKILSAISYSETFFAPHAEILPSMALNQLNILENVPLQNGLATDQ